MEREVAVVEERAHRRGRRHERGGKTAEEHRERHEEGAQRAGHIPTAVSIPWASAVRDDGTFKSAEELRELYETRGVAPSQPVTAYCRIGERSAHTWFVLSELLGYEDVRNYDGSWTEWGNLVDVPIEKGS